MQYAITKGLTKAPSEYPDAKSQPHVQVGCSAFLPPPRRTPTDRSTCLCFRTVCVHLSLVLLVPVVLTPPPIAIDSLS